MDVEGTFKIRKRGNGSHIEVTFEPKEAAGASKRTKRFSSYDGMRRYLLDLGIKQDKIPAAQELRLDQSLSIADQKVDRDRLGL
jgi:hypothetical protein